jgi:hypothetical protein
MLSRSARSVALALSAAVFAACSEGPAAPETPDAELEAAFDQMASDANRQGDAETAADFSTAAMAVRFGIEPTTIGVTVGDKSERYLAFVHAVKRQLENGETVSHKTLIAWAGGRRPTAVLRLSTVSERGTLSFPTPGENGERPDPRTHALGTWHDRVTGKMWVATSGTAGIAQKSTGGPCPRQPPTDRGVQCTTATFAVALNGEFHPIVARDRREIARNTKLNISTAAESVNGAVLSLSR